MSLRPGPCRHEAWEPVESIVTGEQLATICAACLDRLPLTYDGAVTAIRLWGQEEPIAYVPAR